MGLFVDIHNKLGNFRLDICFEIQHGTLGLLGASGCGKSLTLKCIAGIVTPDKGKIVLDDTVLFDSEKGINLPPQARGTGYLFQNYALFPNMTVSQNITSGIKNKSERTNALAELLSTFQLEGVQNHYPSQLSGGQQQRVALARMLASQPRILMLDEPFSAIDSFLRWQLEQELCQILKSFQGTTLFVSHSRDEVYRVCDSMAVISNGKIDCLGDTHQLFDNPKTLSCAKTTGCKNISSAVIISPSEVYATDWGLSFDLSIDKGTLSNLNKDLGTSFNLNKDLGTSFNLNKDWGPSFNLNIDSVAPFDLNKNIPPSRLYLGIRAHSFRRVNSKVENSFRCKIVNIIEAPFSVTVLLITEVQSSSPALCWEIEKGQFDSTLKVGQDILLSVDINNILIFNE